MNRARVLIVDDAPDNLDVLASLLMPDYSVIAATNGPDALRLALDKDKPDIILLDIMMHGMDGYQVCSTLKAHEETCDIPVIFVTAMSDIEHEQKGLLLGAVDYVTKPFNPVIVRARVETHLSLYSKSRLLQSAVQERTRELERAKREAERSSQAKSLFLTNMSHELKTPLNGMLGMIQILMLGNPSQEQQSFLQEARKSGERLLALVNDLLALARLESKGVDAAMRPFRISRELSGFTKIYREQASRKGLRFDLEVDTDVPEMLEGDPGLIRQVLMNLLNNAFRYTDKGRISLRVSSWQVGGQKKPFRGSYLLFVVKDSGSGIPADKLEDICEPFVIGEEYMTKRNSRAGLGLAISRRLVEHMGGALWLESEEGRGTAANFTVVCREMTA